MSDILAMTFWQGFLSWTTGGLFFLGFICLLIFDWGGFDD